MKKPSEHNILSHQNELPESEAIEGGAEELEAGSDFEEAAHLSSDGSFDMYEIVRALYESGFTGPIRPDHGRMIWGEEAMPGYGLYDRALGAAYINGLWEAIEKAHGGVR